MVCSLAAVLKEHFLFALSIFQPFHFYALKYVFVTRLKVQLIKQKCWVLRTPAIPLFQH